MSGYGVVLADPPWRYGNMAVQGGAAKEYGTMDADAIEALPVSEAAAESAVLLLWATWPLLPQACRLVEAWGFTYKTALPWVKVTSVAEDAFEGLRFEVPYGVGFWVRGASEPLLIAARGDAKPPRDEGFIGLLSPNLQHSRKPDSVYALAESMPGPYLEMFARRRRPGWDVYGNQAPGERVALGAAG